ncbi:MAG: LysR family transcriptional regulator [Burkholderiales bacterium]
MDLKWLEDFLSLAETRSFSRAAAQRNVTQPAFSRRIRALEAWVGCDLVDRSVYPPPLTPAGKAFRESVAGILQQLYETRSVLRGQQKLPGNAIQFAVSHTLTLTHLPGWLLQIEERFGPIMAQVLATNVHDGVLALIEGSCDLLLCYQHPQLPLLLDNERYSHIAIGRERMMPYSTCTRNGKPAFELPGTAANPLPYHSYTPNSLLGRTVDMILQHAPEPPHFLHRHQTDMAEALKALLLTSKGIGWLPERAVTHETTAGQFALAGGKEWSAELEVRLYRANDNANPIIDRLWAFLTRVQSP